jgi:hypothetical protein
VSPETQAFLDQVRDAEAPSPEVEARVLRALNATVAAGALGAGAWSASKLVKLLVGGALSGWKGGALGLCLLVATSAVVWPREREEEAQTRPVEVAHARVALEPTAAPAPTAAPSQLAPPLEKSRPVPTRPSAVPARLSSLRAELSLLSQVQAALRRGEGSEALRLLDQHRTSDRQLDAERAAARVLALCAAGQTEQARRAAAVFTRQHPGSVQTAAVARSCAGQEQP